MFGERRIVEFPVPALRERWSISVRRSCFAGLQSAVVTKRIGTAAPAKLE